MRRPLVLPAVLVILAFAGGSAVAAPIRVSSRVFSYSLESVLPFEGARVELYPLGVKAEAPIASARSGADGTFEVQAPDSGLFRLRIDAPGFFPMEYFLVPLVEEVELPAAPLMPVLEVEIRAAGPAGRPLAGVELTASSSETSGFPEDIEAWLPAGRSGTTDAEGRWRLPVLPGETVQLSSLRPGFRGHLAANIGASGGAVTVPFVRVPPAPLEAGGLPPQQTFAGRVIDAASKRPVAGALVWSGPATDPLAPLRSGPDGRFELRTARGASSIRAGAAGYLRPEARLASGSGPVEIALPLAATLTGQVVTTGGQPVPGAEIRFTIDRHPGAPAFLEPIVRSRPDGTFHLPRLLPGGVYELRVAKAGFAPAAESVRTAPAGKATRPVRIELDAGRTVFGRVVDAEGRAVPVARVGLIPEGSEGGEGQVETSTDAASGRFEIPHLPPGRFILRVSHRAFAPLRRPGIEILPNGPRLALGDLELSPGAVVEGRVVDERGRPIAQADVAAEPELGSMLPSRWASEGNWFPEAIQTKEDGSFTLSGLEQDLGFQVSAGHPGYVSVTLPNVKPPLSEPLRIELRTGRSLEGRVVGPQGEPVADALLYLVQEVGFSTGGSGSSGRSASLAARTDPQGRFRIDNQVPGSIDLEVNARGYQTRMLRGVRIPESGEPERLEIRLGGGAVLEGRVFDGRGRPVPGALVQSYPARPSGSEDSYTRDGVTDSEGKYRLEAVPSGEHRVWAGRDDQGAVRIDVPYSGTVHLDLTSRGMAELAGRVSLPDGTPLPGVKLRLAPLQSGSLFDATSEPDGSFLFSQVPEGGYRLSADKPGFLDPEPGRAVQVTGEGVSGLEILLIRGRLSIAGRLLGLGSKETPGMTIRAYGGGSGAEGETDRQGGYRVDVSSPGMWTVEAKTESGRRAVGAAQVELGVPETLLDLDFGSEKEGYTVTGRVTVDGRPLQGAEVSLFDRTSTDYEGRFTVREVPAGRHTLLIAGQNGLGHIRTVQISQDEEIAIEIRTGRANGTVLSATGEPVAGATVLLEGAASGVSFRGPSVLSGPQGTFELAGVAPGIYDVKIQKEGFRPAQMRIEVPPGGEARFEAQLVPVD